MTNHVPVQKPLEDDALFKTLRGLHPSAAQLREINIVERVTLERLKATKTPSTKVFRVFKDARNSASAALHRR